MTICPSCNGYIPDYTIGDFFAHHCPPKAVTTPVPIIYKQVPHCDHCYCRKSEDKSHKICCNCGNKQGIINGE